MKTNFYTRTNCLYTIAANTHVHASVFSLLVPSHTLRMRSRDVGWTRRWQQTNCFYTGKNKDIKHIMIVIGLDVLTLIFMWVNACTYFRFDSTLNTLVVDGTRCSMLSVRFCSMLCYVCVSNASDSFGRKKTDTCSKPFTKLTYSIHLSVPFIKPTHRS